jgi:glycerol kinase
MVRKPLPATSALSIIIAGLTSYAAAGHLARAALEASAYQTFDVVDAMQRDSGVKIRTRG